MNLSPKAIEDLRFALRNKYGSEVDIALNDIEVNEIGALILNLVAQKIN